MAAGKLLCFTAARRAAVGRGRMPADGKTRAGRLLARVLVRPLACVLARPLARARISAGTRAGRSFTHAADCF